jgi:hypothetical protein
MNGEALLQQLTAAVGGDATSIAQATKALQSVAGSPGTSIALAHIGLQQQLDFGVRHLALLVSYLCHTRLHIRFQCALACADPGSMAGVMPAQALRQHIRKHWTREAPDSALPIIVDDEKAAVRAALPAGLADSNSKLRTAVGLAVAAIAKWDSPDAWPDLLDNLLHAIDQRDNVPLGELRVRGMTLSNMHYVRTASVLHSSELDHALTCYASCCSAWRTAVPGTVCGRADRRAGCSGKHFGASAKTHNHCP